MPRIVRISSAENPKYKLYRDLLSAKGIKTHQLALVSGQRQVEEVLARHAGLARTLVATGKMPILAAAEELDRIELSHSLFDELDVVGTGSPLLVIETPSPRAFAAEMPWPKGCTVFIGFQNPENVGAVIRTAAAFNAPRIVLLREAANPFLPKSFRAAGPAVFDVPLLIGPSIKDMSAVTIPLVTLDSRGKDLASSSFPETFGLVAGLEGPGLPSNLRQNDCRRIPALGQESLNGATAVAIALYEWRRSQMG